MSRHSRIAEYSVLHGEFISRFVRLHWGWNRATAELWHRGVSDTYRIARERECAFLKVYRHGWRTRDEILGEVALLRCLIDRGMRVAQPIRNSAGRFVESINAPEGLRFAVLFSEADGVVPAFDVENSRKYGFMAATFHRVTDQVSEVFRRPSLGIAQIVREPLARARTHLDIRPRDFAYLNRLSGELAEAVSSLLPLTSPEFGMCHGDLTFGNVRRNSRRQLTMFDFDCAGYGWRAYDIAVFLQSRGDKFTRSAVASRMRQWDAFVDGYHAVRSLSGEELHAANLFVPLRQVWQMGMHTNHLAHMGRRSRRDETFEWRLEFIKNWLKAYKLL